jgi:L-lactate dehydrogenase complex protein LldG
VSDARADVLARVRAALAGPDGVPAAVPEVPRDYRGAGRMGPAGAPDVVERFCVRVEEYSATVRRAGRGELAAVVAAVCRERGTARLAVPAGGLGGESIDGVELVEDDPPLSPRALDGIDGVLTGCALAIAETGTIALDGGARSGRRALTLVPDHHVCVVEADDVVAGVPDAVARLAEAARAGRPVTLVSGPSATSDIELERVEGVHGPRRLDVIVVAG